MDRFPQASGSVHAPTRPRLLRKHAPRGLSELRLRWAYSPRPPHSWVWLGGRRLSGHRPRRDFRDDRKLSQRDDLGRDAEEPVRPPRPYARRFRGWLADRVRTVGRTSPTMSFRGSLALPLAAALSLLVCGCTSRGDNANLVRFWAMGREGEVVTELLPEFERTHPGIHVEVQQLPWSAAHEKLLTAFAGDSTPDLCQLGNTWISEFV